MNHRYVKFILVATKALIQELPFCKMSVNTLMSVADQPQ